MAESMSQLLVEAQLALDDLGRQITARNWSSAAQHARRTLSAASKLHQRLRVLVDVGDDAAYAVAEVDRALQRAAAHEQGELPTGEALKARRAPRGKRKGV